MQVISPKNYRTMEQVIPSGFSRLVAIRLCGLWLLVFSSLSPAAVNDHRLTDEGQRAYDKGRFSEAAEQWQTELDQYREQGNAEAEIRVSIALAGACQAIGQHRRSVRTLESALALAESSGAQSQLALLKSRLGAALTMTREPGRAAVFLNSALETARATRDLKLEGAILNDLGNLCFPSNDYWRP